MRTSDEQKTEATGPVQDGQRLEKDEPDGYVGRHRRFAWRSAAMAVLALVATVLSAAAGGAPAQAAVAGCTRTASFQVGQATVFAPADNSYSWRCTMRRGTGSWSNDTSWHWGVFQLQETMNNCYGSVIGTLLSTDGDFGGRTETALIKVQRHLRSTVDGSLAADGVYGPHTAATMSHWAFAQTPYGTFHVCTRLR